jgi:hypothetical protein
MLCVSLVPLGMLAVSLLVATHDSSASSDGGSTDSSREMTSRYADTGYRR